MDKKDREVSNSMSSHNSSSDGVMELSDDITDSVVGGMAEEYAAKERFKLAEKLSKKRIRFPE